VIIRYFHILLFLLCFSSLKAGGDRRPKDSTNIYQKIDTNFVENYKDMLNAKLIAVVRTNKFSIKNKLNGSTLEYSINTNINMGIGLNFKGIGFEFQFNPKGLNKDDATFGKSTQFAIASSANTRRFIYDAFYRYNQGFHTTALYRMPGDTIYDYYKRADIRNYNAGVNLIYIFNNKRFSSAAPYSLTQRQRKSAGSMLLGSYFFLYGIDADSLIYPDTLYKNFNPEVQFADASSVVFGISCGYTYTFVFFRHWFANIATIPGISLQQFYSVNTFSQKVYSRSSASISLQSRLSIGYNRKNYFIGISWMNNNFLINDSMESTVNYKFGTFRFYYGHRFDLRNFLKKKL
jgi:hypothetical protein